MNNRFRPRTWGVEMLIGLALAGLTLIVAWTSSGDVPFVYGGL